jgi:hypothetical protein
MPIASVRNTPADQAQYNKSFFTTGGTAVNPQTLAGGIQVNDPGFCPWNTFCDTTGNHQSSDPVHGYPDGNQPDPTISPNPPAGYASPIYAPDLLDYNAQYCKITDQQTQPIWWSLTSVSLGAPFTMPKSPAIVPSCTSDNPDARHWCMDNTTGAVNPMNGACSPHYDATDYARDQVDFAALIDYTSKLKGNFIAMFSVFFRHDSAANLNEYILGAKFMRYVADAGDNGIIDNHVQKWYRTNLPLLPTTTDQYPPTYDGKNVVYGSSAEDPCAQYDFRETGDLPSNNPALNAQYEALVTHNCGNYYYASSSNAINLAFADIASRLFTRLTR